MSIPILPVSANGNLIILSRPEEPDLHEVSIDLYNANGSLQQKIILSKDIFEFRFRNVMQKPNGNLVLVSFNDQFCGRKLTEIDTRGSIVRQYQSRLIPGTDANFADIYGRIMIVNMYNQTELVDDELNLLDFADPQLSERRIRSMCPLLVDLNRERNEIVRFSYASRDKMFITTFRFAEK